MDGVAQMTSDQMAQFKLPSNIEALLKLKVSQMTKETSILHKEALILYQSDYSELRKTPGLEELGDLKATEEDAIRAERIALNMGIPKEFIKKMTNFS